MDIFDDYHDDEWIRLKVYFSDGVQKSWLSASINFDNVADKFIHIHNDRSLICIPLTSVDYCEISIAEMPSYAHPFQVIEYV